MSFLNFIKDKILFIAVQFIVLFLSYEIMITFNLNKYVIILIEAIYICGVFVPMIFEFIKKRNYYDKLFKKLNNLDKKHLVSEIIETPNFSEGQILYDILKLSGKSMNDEINNYKNSSQEYREYIEAWVHEVKTPITAAKLIIENNKNKITENISDEINKIEEFVEQALYYSKSNNVEKDYIIKKISLDYIMKKTLKKHSKILISTKTKIVFNNLNFEVFTDEKWIDFILGQIISNSIKYRIESPELILSAKSKENSIVLCIRDNGIGIPNKDIKKVFLKGFVGESGRKTNQSTGIGLYLCKKLCEKMGLNISIISQINEGTEVFIEFPKNKNVIFE